MRSRCASAVTLLSLLALLPAGCGTSPAEAPATVTPPHKPDAQAREPVHKPAAQPIAPIRSAERARVTIDNFAYAPRVLTVSPRTRVTWINQDDVPHTVTSTARPRAFASDALDTNDTFERVFDRPGTYEYFCAVHPHMTATVIVK